MVRPLADTGVLWLLKLRWSLAIYRFHRHGGASVHCSADLGAALPAAFVPLISARCAVTSLVAGWLRLIYHHRWHGVAGDMFVLLVAVVTQMLTAILFFAAAASRVAAETQLWLTRVRVATARPLFTVDVQFMLMLFDQG